MLLTDNKSIRIDQSQTARRNSGIWDWNRFCYTDGCKSPDVHKLLKTGHIWNNGQEFLTQLQHASLEKLNQTSL